MPVTLDPEILKILEKKRDEALKELEMLNMGNQIIINLDKIRDAEVVKSRSDMIHLGEYDRFIELLSESLKKAKDYSGSDTFRSERSDCNEDRPKCRLEENFKRNHDTIMLAGVRGSGKTTFMLSIMDHIKNGTLGDKSKEKFPAECGIEVLPIFDPTLIEEKAHIFTNIVAMIKAKVDTKAKKSNCFSDDDSDGFKQYQRWEKSFETLAVGIPTIDGIGGNGYDSDSWLDPKYVMDRGVQMASAANFLEKDFHEFIRQSLRFLCKDAFLLCFDDVDTNFSKGWPVLEVLRKYLTSPQLITVLSGDLALYSILIKDQQWTNFSDKILQREYRSKFDRDMAKNRVSHLVEQYMLKLLKSERRIFLDSLYRKGQRFGEGNILVKGKNFNAENMINLRAVYSEILKNRYGVYSGGQLETTYRFLASTPLRTQVQILSHYDAYKSSDSRMNISELRRSELSDHFIDVFWTALDAKGVEVTNLRNVPHYTVPQIIDYLVRNEILEEGYTLTPNYSDHFVNSAQFTLGTLLTDRIKDDPSQIFEFWIRVCLTRELAKIFDKNIDVDERGPSVEDYIEACAVTNLRTSRYIARNATAYIRAYLGKISTKNNAEPKIAADKGSWHATIPIYGFSSKAGRALPDRIDYVLKSSDYFTWVAGYLPLSGATNHKGESVLIYSFYNLIGVLGELIIVARNSDESVAKKELIRTLIKNSQYREYSLPTWGNGLLQSDESGSGFDDGFEVEITEDDISKFDDEFAESLKDWAREDLSEVLIAPFVLAKIFTRFFYSTNNLDQELRGESLLGNWMHRLTIIFLHSTVLVEAMEKLDLTGIRPDLRNPITKDKIFIDNIRAFNASGASKGLKFSKWMLSCPIWKLFLKNKFDYSEVGYNPEHEFHQFINTKSISTHETEKYPDTIHGYNLIELLNRVRVKSNIQLPSFKVDLDECRDSFILICNAKSKTKDIILKMEYKDLTQFMKDNLAGKYNARSITKKTVESIVKRLIEGTWVI